MYEKIRVHIKKLVISALFLALCLLLPFVTGQIQKIGQMLAPMHIPVMLCGIVCGSLWGAAVGFIAPLLRYMLFGMPTIYPMGISMAFELAAYGLIIGLLYRAFGKRKWGLIVSLVGAMVCGRAVWGMVRLILAGLKSTQFTAAMFISGAFTTAVPGIICQMILIPLIVALLKRLKLIPIK